MWFLRLWYDGIYDAMGADQTDSTNQVGHVTIICMDPFLFLYRPMGISVNIFGFEWGIMGAFSIVLLIFSIDSEGIRYFAQMEKM